MSPRRRDDDLESFDPEFDDDVFAAPHDAEDADAFDVDDPSAAPPKPRKPRKPRVRKAARAEPAPRGRRALRIGGMVALALVLVLFVISFISGLGGDAGERVVGDAEEAAAELDRIGPRIKVEVLNAAGVAGLARLATEQLRDRGFDVVSFGNAGASAGSGERTIVVARTGDVDDARQVAAALGADSVAVDPDPQLFLDVTVLLGRDWPRAEADPAPERTGFRARFRRLFRSE